MRIVWDLDGVIRDLNGYIARLYGGAYPTRWNYTCGNGKSIYETVSENLDILKDSPPTAYCEVLKKHIDYPEFWTSQPEHWRPYTNAWLDKHIGVYKVHFLKCEQKEKELKACIDTVLIEDSPNFKSYKNILLIDRPYNQDVDNVMRIFGTKHLDNLISMMKGDKV